MMVATVTATAPFMIQCLVASHCIDTGQTELDRPGRFCVESYFTESEMQGCPHHKTEMRPRRSKKRIETAVSQFKNP